MPAAKRRPERMLFRVTRDGLVPADGITEGRFRARRYAAGDRVFVELKKPRNPGFHRLAHALGKLLVDQLDTFRYCDAHSALKRLQAESGIGCEPLSLDMDGETVVLNMPISLSYESMEQGEFYEVYNGLCSFLAEKYWPDCTQEQIRTMVELMPESA